MDRYERITALHRLLKSARYPVTVATLQDKRGWSRATVYRDLAFLRDALMAPIEGDGEAGFRYHADESDRFELPGLWLSSEELHALLASQHLLARTGGGVLSSVLAPLQQRIESLLAAQAGVSSWPAASAASPRRCLSAASWRSSTAPVPPTSRPSARSRRSA
ncbi:hypothetical protein G6F59_014881 [Rhizopus arrhizus]|nr:hypothetical protein G6F59_014881 [Rhizopus arrhizus]